MKILKALLKIIIGICVLVIILFAISSYILYSVDINQHKDIVIAKFADVTGQELVLNGPIAINIFPLPYIELNNAELNIKQADKKVKIFAEYLKADFNLKSFLTQKKEVNAITTKKVVVKLFKNNQLINTWNVDEFAGKVFSSCCDLTLPAFTLKTGGNDLAGSFKIIYGSPYVINAQLNANRWSFKSTDNASELLTFEPEDLDWLDKIKASIQFKANNLQVSKTLLKNADLKIDIDKKRLNVTHHFWYEAKNVNGKFQLSQDTKSQRPVIAANFTIKQERTQDLDGNLTFLFLKNSTVVKGQLYSPAWQIDLLENGSQQHFFSHDPLSVAWLNNLQGEIEYKTDNLLVEKLKLQNALVHLKFKDDLLEITPTGFLAGGKFNGKFFLKRIQKTVPEIKGHFVVRGANASEFLNLFKSYRQLSGGRLNLTFEGSSRGSSEAELMAHLSGDMLLQIHKMRILNQVIDSRYVDFLAAFWKNLLSHQDNTLLECGVMRMKIRNGVAQSKNGIGLETRELYALGTGSLNLKNEQLDYVFTLYPRHQVNLEVGSFENVLLLKGTMSKPQLVTTTQGIIQEGGSLLLGYATGGLSILAEKIFKVMTQKGSPCQEVLSHPD